MAGTQQKLMSAFETWVRTGRRIATHSSRIEYKFNGWHDPNDGKFTEVGAGRYFGPGSRLVAPQRSDDTRFSAYDPRNPQNFSVLHVKPGDSLTRLAKLRKGLTVDDLAWLNNIDLNAPLAIGQKIRLPHQRFLDQGRDARDRFLALAYYMDAHGGKLPADPSHPPSLDSQIDAERVRRVANGYTFNLDLSERTREVDAQLRLNRAQGRSKAAQAAAGGENRRFSDEGGHFIARMFDGPRNAFNHFAQDKTFNRSGYRKIENRLRVALLNGHKVSVHIEALYENHSERPRLIKFRYSIDGKVEIFEFPNGTGK